PLRIRGLDRRGAAREPVPRRHARAGALARVADGGRPRGLLHRPAAARDGGAHRRVPAEAPLVTRLHVVEVGTGFPVVLVPGAPGMDHTHWRPWLEPLADEFRLIFYDQRGHGRSERVAPEELTLELFALDIDIVAQRLELERFAVLGHSFGAVVATHHAIH